MNSLFVFASALLAIALTSLLYVLIYQIWFHPLAKYPGPLLARLTNGYAAYHSWKGDLHIDMLRCHNKYGDYIRYGSNQLLFNTAASLRDIYSTGKNVQKSKNYLAMMSRAPNTITLRDKKLHSQRRRLLSNGFSESALRAYDAPLGSHIRNFCCSLSQDDWDRPGCMSAKGRMEWSSPKNMAHWCSYLAFDIMLDTVYGAKCDMVNNKDHRPLLDAIAKSNIRVGVIAPLYTMKNTIIDRWLFWPSIVARGTFITFVKKLLLDKSTDQTKLERPTVYDILMNANEGEGLKPVEIAAESTNLIVAGFDTTATVLAAFLFYISRYPKVYERVAGEVRSCFSSTEEIHDRSKISTCLYLRACIDETLRMAPPVAACPFREVEAGGIVVDNQHLPACCDVGVAIYSIHHNPQYYPDPFQFSPERWRVGEGKTTKEAVEVAQSAFTPFSIGPRACIGRGLAIMEITSILAAVLYSFDFKVADGPEGRLGEGTPGVKTGRHRVDEYQLYDHLTAAREGPVLQFRAR